LEKIISWKFKTYKIHFEDDINLTADITKTTESWRPKQDTFYLHRKIRNLIGSASTSGKVNVSYNYDNNEINTSGSGYHDHNWGNNSIMELFNHWYWSRAEIPIM
jgi:hypothetical protein